MKHPIILALSSMLMLVLPASAQNSVRMPDPFASLKASEKKGLIDQATSFFEAAKPAVKNISRSTVTISYRGNRICFGTVVSLPDAKEPVIITKWSEVASVRTRLVATNPDGNHYPAVVSGVYPEHDLAVLKVNFEGAELNPIDLRKTDAPGLGDFIALARPDGSVEGFGVVSVLNRSLREKDKAYLGVMMDFADAGSNGVPLQQVMPDSAAARAGLKDGDVITSVGNTQITGAMEMRNLLQRLEPGSKITITFRRGIVEKNTTVQLGSRADNADIRRVPRERMNRMERMGTVPSHVRTNFPSVIQSDMPINPQDAGAPIADLDGNFIGIAIARGSRIKTYVIPTSTLQTLLASKPQPVNDAMAMGRNNAGPRYGQTRRTAPRAIPENEDDTINKVRQLLDETKRRNAENAEQLRRIEDALRRLNEAQRRGRNR